MKQLPAQEIQAKLPEIQQLYSRYESGCCKTQYQPEGEKLFFTPMKRRQKNKLLKQSMNLDRSMILPKELINKSFQNLQSVDFQSFRNDENKNDSRVLATEPDKAQIIKNIYIKEPGSNDRYQANAHKHPLQENSQIFKQGLNN